MAVRIATIKAADLDIPVYRTAALVAGSGAASLACALHLKRLGESDVLIATDNLNGGTSLNTGSDKQTYYKLSDSTPEPDSPYEMARAFISGGCMHGDIALVEALCSSRAFYNLVNIGVPFPRNRYGGYTGYKTDHDPANRGTSIGPFTSKMMVQQLLTEVKRFDTEIWNSHDIVRLFSTGNRAVGALVMDKRLIDRRDFGLKIILADNIVFGLGGPAGFYESSVYPKVHSGGIGLALEIGAEAANLTEMQFGIASVKHRWNLSGSYQQVIPSYYSTDAEGGDRQDFLLPYFSDFSSLAETIFLKGYQWPFDSAKVRGGSSLIDLLVHIEKNINGRRVFMDFRENPKGRPDWENFSRDCLSAKVLEYLDNSSAWADSPFERLERLNPDSIGLYKCFGIELENEPLEIDVCAQHNNGGLSADIWWESTNISRLFPVGEVNGTHGITRPGGSALNSGQVGGIRAAERILSYRRQDALEPAETLQAVRGQIDSAVEFIKTVSTGAGETDAPGNSLIEPESYRREFRRRMNTYGGMVRSAESFAEALREAERQLKNSRFQSCNRIEELPLVMRNRHMVIAHFCYLAAMADYLDHGGGSRGSCLVTGRGGPEIHPLLDEHWRIKEENTELRNFVQIIKLNADALPESPAAVCEYRECRPIPEEEYWFEKVWSEYKSENRIKES